LKLAFPSLAKENNPDYVAFLKSVINLPANRKAFVHAAKEDVDAEYEAQLRRRAYLGDGQLKGYLGQVCKI